MHFSPITKITLFTVLILYSLPSSAEKVEVVWEQRFDAPVPADAWKLEGTAAIKDGALFTCSDLNGPVVHGAVNNTEHAIPAASDGYLLRMEWALVPLKIGGWGQDANIGGPFVVEFTGAHPTLNAKYGARDAIEPGKESVLSCDFNRHMVFDWRINGKPQLDAPVPAWHPGYAAGKVSLADFKDTNSETRWLWVRLSKVVPDDPLPLQLSGWGELPDVQPGTPSAFLVGQASPMDKVFREAGDFRGSFEPYVRIAAAGRESESFQLVVMPAGAPLKNVRVEITDLIHSDGKTRFEVSHVLWHPVGYIQTRQSNSSIRRAGWWWPDVVMPENAFDVEAGFVQPVWFTLNVPHETTPGAYRGLIRILAENDTRTIGLELTVRNFSLPLRGKLKTAFCFNPGIWEMWYAPDEVKKRLGMDDKTGHGPLYTSYECEEVLPHAKWLEMYGFLLAHRLNPCQIYSGMKNGRTRVVPSRADMDYCYERGMNATCLGNVDVLPADPEAADKWMAQFEAWIQEWDGFVKEKSWPDFTWYVHGFDESEMRPNPVETVDPSIRRVYGMLAEKFPWLKRESANPVNTKHEGLINIWTPLTAQLPSEKMPEAQARQQAGDEMWAYVCCGPGKPYANLFIDFPGVDPRILPWQFFQHGLTGFLYYLINLYEGEENWNMAAPKWPERPWNPYSFRTNSDGILMYPGPDATPLPSTRMENLRDGIEDYEALALLADVTNQIEHDGGHDDFVQKARAALAVKPEVSKSWTEYTQTPNDIVNARAEVDQLIGEGNRLVEKKAP